MGIFDLPTDASELVSANQGVANAKYVQINTTRDVTGNNFPQGIQQFRWEMGGVTHFVPNKSYMRIRCTLTQCRADAVAMAPILQSQDIAPNMGLAANLYKSLNIQLNGTTIERIGERVPQVDALRQRKTRSGAQMNSLGRSANLMDYDFDIRRQQVAVDGYFADEKAYNPTYGVAGTGVNNFQGQLTRPESGFLEADRMSYPAGALPLAGLLAITGTVTFTVATGVLVGAGTAFLSELRVGDRVIINVVNSVIITSIATDTAAVTSISGIANAGGGSALLIVPEEDKILTFATAGATNILIGAAALRPGDKIIHTTEGVPPLATANVATFEVVEVLTLLSCRVKLLSGLPVDTHNIVAGTFQIQKLSGSTRNDSVHKNQFEMIWRPPLGFFELPHAIPPGGVWTLEFNPENESQYRKNVVESLLADLTDVQDGTPTASLLAGQFSFRIEQVQLYLYTLESSRFDNGSYLLDIKSMRCQIQNMQNDSTGLQQKNFDVASRTTALTLAFQDQQQGNDTRRSRSKFKIRPTANAPKGQELLLTRFYVQYAGMQRPQPDYDGQYTFSNATSLTVQINNLEHRYVDSQLQANSYDAEGGTETFVEWMERGMYFYFAWPTDATQLSTVVNVNFRFSTSFDGTSTHQVLLFNEWRNAVRVTVEDGRVKSVVMEEL